MLPKIISKLVSGTLSYDKVQRTTSRLDDFTTYELTTFTTSRLVIDLETGIYSAKMNF